MTPEERIASLEAENARQREQLAVLLAQNTVLLARVQELEARLAGQRQPQQLEATLQ